MSWKTNREISEKLESTCVECGFVNEIWVSSRLGIKEKHYFQNSNCSVLNFNIFTINFIPGEIVVDTNGEVVVGSTQQI